MTNPGERIARQSDAVQLALDAAHIRGLNMTGVVFEQPEQGKRASLALFQGLFRVIDVLAPEQSPAIVGMNDTMAIDLLAKTRQAAGMPPRTTELEWFGAEFSELAGPLNRRMEYDAIPAHEIDELNVSLLNAIDAVVTSPAAVEFAASCGGLDALAAGLEVAQAVLTEKL